VEIDGDGAVDAGLAGRVSHGSSLVQLVTIRYPNIRLQVRGLRP
jgi:hypothetical protein